jgi:hypothetical protein
MPTAAKHDSKGNQADLSAKLAAPRSKTHGFSAPNDVVFFGKLPGRHNIGARLCPVKGKRPLIFQ